MDEHTRLAQQLIQHATSPDDGRRRKALKKLRSLVELYPTELNYRIALAMALAIGRSCDEAITQARKLEKLDTGTHHVEHTLAEVYLICGDSSRARRHAMEAERLAGSAEDYRDARELLRRIDADSPGGGAVR